jgi:hypothetical protein
VNEKFDELAKGMTQSTTRRSALRKFGIGLTGIVLASLGLASRAEAGHVARHCNCKKYTCDCSAPYAGCSPFDYCCMQLCLPHCG